MGGEGDMRLDDLAEQLVTLTIQLNDLHTLPLEIIVLRQHDNQHLQQREQEHLKLVERHNELQEALYAKNDEVAELKADIHDMKQVYRKQISDLIGKIEEYSKRDKTVIGH
jgi:uncharacterized protein YlxW (UPF0749 family)